MLLEIVPQLCGLIIDILLLIFCLAHKNLRIYKEKIFYLCLIVTTVSLVVDIFSIICIYYPNIFNETFTKIICKLYLVSLIFCAASTIIYLYADIFSKKTHQGLLLYAGLILFLIAVGIYLSQINLVTSSNSVYTNGPAVLMTYIICAVFIAITLVSAFCFRKKINPRRAFAIYLWMGIWIAGAMFQFFNNEAPIVGFCASVGMLILSTIVENPEGNVDREYACFNSYALNTYINSLAEDEIEYAAIEISLDGLRTDRKDAERALIKAKSIIVANKIQKIKNVFVFKNQTTGFIVIIKDKNSLNEVVDSIKNTLKEQNMLNESTCIIVVEGASMFENTTHLQSFFDSLKMNHECCNCRTYFANEDETFTFNSRFSISTQIDNAIKEDRVEVYFQPIYSSKDKYYSAAEALVRIKNPNGTLLPPKEFIPVAEETGQITQLSKIILEKICEFLSESNAIELGLKTVDFNLSVSEYRNPNLAKELDEIVEKYKVNPKNIILEVTETASLLERNSFITSMNELIEKGYTFALDDFGKGQSNLSYIIDMPVSILKIDYDMSKSFFKSDKAKIAIKSIISMAHDLNLRIVVEGVETNEENETYLKENIDFIQGFFHSNALTMGAFINFLEEKNSQSLKK